MPRPATAPGLFAPWANCVFYHTLSWSLSECAAVKQAGHLSKPLFPGEKSCHLCMCHFCLAALSHLLAHFARAGEICATCHCLPVWQWDWWNILSALTMVTDRVFTSSCVGKRGRRPQINTIFMEKDGSDSISETLSFSSAVNKKIAFAPQKRLLFGCTS